MDIQNQRKNIIKFIKNDDLAELKKFINIYNIDLREINNIEFDLLIFSIDEYASPKLINYIIQQCQYKTLNYTFNTKNGYSTYNNNSFIQNNEFISLKTPLYTAIINKNFEISNLLIKNGANINYGVFNENLGEMDILSYLCYVDTVTHGESLDIENLKYILNNGFYIKGIAKDMVNKLIFLIQMSKINIIEMIFKYYIFDNSFIINLLNNYIKNKNGLSDIELQNIILKEKSKLVIDEILYQIAIREENYEAIKIFLDYDSSQQTTLINRIVKYNILEKSVSTNNFTLIEKILNCKNYIIPTNLIENIIINECKHNNIKKVEIFIKNLKSDILNTIDFKKILYELSHHFSYCYNEPVMKILIEVLLNISFDDFNNIGTVFLKNYDSQYLNLILNILLEIGNLNLVQCFIENLEIKLKIDVNVKDIVGTYPIFVAVHTNKIEIFEYLIKKGTKYYIKVKNDTSTTLLSTAINSYNYMVVKYLLNTDILYMEDVNYNNYHPLIKAIYQNQSDRVKALLSSESLNEINKDSTKFVICHFTPLILSYLLNNKEIFEILIKFFDINELDSFGYNLLYYAILKEDIKMINYLINNGIDINFMKSRSKGRYHSALDISILIKNKEIFNILINNEKILLNIPNKLGEIPLITILKYNDCNIIFKKEIIEQLLLKGANINLTFKHKNSPLIYSIQEKSLILTELLIQNGATINFIDDYGDTPLIYAVKENSYPIVKLLIENNANVNYTDEQGYTPLFYAVRSDSISLVKLLIENGADINNRKSIPIIESAFLNNSLSMIQLIMENGFDFTITYKIESILISYFNKGK